MPLQIVATDSVPGQTLTYSATGLPPGLSISSSGLVTGTPTTQGTFNVVVTVTDQLGVTGTIAFSWFITPPTGNIVTVANPGDQNSPANSPITNVQMSATDSASGQTLTFSATGLPTGLSISSAGLISGTPTPAGNFVVTVTAIDTTNAYGSVTFNWTITGGGGGNTITVANPGTQTNNVGNVISLQMTATDSASGQTLTYTAAGLPPGLSINNTGLISGTISGPAQSYGVTVTAKDTTNATGSTSFTWVVVVTPNIVTVNNPGNQTNTVGNNVNLVIIATDSASGQTLTYSATGLPAGLSIGASSGVISGSPTTVQTTNALVKAIDTTGSSGTAAFTWTINPSTGYVPRVGCTVPNNCRLNAGCYDTGLSQIAADQLFVAAVSRPSASATEVLACKRFWGSATGSGGNPGWVDLTKNSMAMFQANGTRVMVCIQPNLTTPDTTTYQALITMANSLSKMGFTSDQLNFVFWQEPEVNAAARGMTPALYGNCLTYYGPALTTTNALAADGKPFRIVCDIGSGGGGTTAQAYANAAVNAWNASPKKNQIPLLGLAQDFYCPQYYEFFYKSGTSSLDTIASVANTNNLPSGVYEWGCAPTPISNQFKITFAQAQAVCQNYLNYVHAYMKTRLLNGLKNLDVMYYDGQCSATGATDLTSPIGQDPSVSSPDFRISGTPISGAPFPTQNATVTSGNANFHLATSTNIVIPVNTPVVMSGTIPGGFTAFNPYFVIASGSGTIKLADATAATPVVITPTSTVNSGLLLFIGNVGYQQIFDDLNGG